MDKYCDAVKCLIGNYANRYIEDHFGETPLDTAEKMSKKFPGQYDKIIALLKDKRINF